MKVKGRHERPSSAPIGVFDSGLGGLSILKHLRRMMPHERFIFLADQAYVPYGGKSGKQIRARTTKIAQLFLRHKTKAIVVACNTATVYAIEHLRNTFSVPFIGTVPAVKPACRDSKRKIIAVLSTPATAKSPALKKLVRAYAQQCTVVRIGCAGLEEAVEHGALDNSETRGLLEKYLRTARSKGADRLVLGCTHYPFLKRTIRSILPVPTVDSGVAVARQTKNILTKRDILRVAGPGSITYLTTGTSSSFTKVASLLLKTPIRASKAVL